MSFHNQNERFDHSVSFSDSSIADGSDAYANAIVLPRRAWCDANEPIFANIAFGSVRRRGATSLINRKYAWRGYGDHHILPDRWTHTTFTAEKDQEAVGTITLAVDSDKGLSADATFKNELDATRQISGTRICELTKFAFDTAKPSKDLIACLFHIVFVYGSRIFRCTDLFIEVNPRHVRFYQSMLGFEKVGDLKTNASVCAPAQLMRLKVSEIRRRIDIVGGALESQCRSLYPYFFQAAEEEALFEKMGGLASERTSPALARPFGNKGNEQQCWQSAWS